MNRREMIPCCRHCQSHTFVDIGIRPILNQSTDAFFKLAIISISVHENVARPTWHERYEDKLARLTFYHFRDGRRRSQRTLQDRIFASAFTVLKLTQNYASECERRQILVTNSYANKTTALRGSEIAYLGKGMP